jgi:hypothetical protein
VLVNIKSPETIANTDQARSAEIITEANVSFGMSPDGTIRAAPGDKRQSSAEIRLPAEILQPLSLKPWTRLFLFVPCGPRSKEELQKFRDVVANRFDGREPQLSTSINVMTGF